MEKKAPLVLSIMLLVSVFVSAEETPTIGQRLDSATNDVTGFFNKHVVPAVDTVISVYNWFGDKAKYVFYFGNWDSKRSYFMTEVVYEFGIGNIFMNKMISMY
ncbi:unnamed protein product [Cochlearia groenlandica]